MAAAPLVLANSSGTVLGTQASIFPGNTHNALVGNTVAVMVSSPSGVSSVTDNASGGSNTYTKVLELQAPSSGNFVSVFTCLVARSLAVDSTERIFLNFPSSTASASWRIIGMGGDWHVSDATGTNSGTGTAVTVTTTGNTGTRNDVVLGAFAFGNTTFTGTNSGTTTSGEPTQQAASLGWVQNLVNGASGSTVTASGTLGASGAWAGAVVTLSPPSGAQFVTAFGTAQNKTAGTTLAISGSVDVAVGDDIFIAFSGDPGAAVTSFTSTGTATLGALSTETSATNSTAVYTSLLRIPVTASGTITGITLTHGSVTARAASAGLFMGVGTRNSLQTNAQTSASSVWAPRYNVGSPATPSPWVAVGDLLLSALGWEGLTADVSSGPVFTLSLSGSLTSAGRLGTTGGSAATNISVDLAVASITATGTTAGSGVADNLSVGRNSQGVAAWYAAAVTGTNWTVTPNDSATLADAVVNAPGPVEADTGTLADAPATQTVTQLAPADTVTGTDVASNGPSTVPADTATLSDSDAEVVGRTTSANDSVTGTDATVNSPAPVEADTLTGTDANVKNVGQVSTDTFGGTPNYVANPSFETDLTGWDPNGPNPGSTITRITSDSFAGSACMQVVCDGLANVEGAHYQATGTFLAGHTYTLSAYIKSISGSTGFKNIVIFGFNASNYGITTSWARYTDTKTLAADASVLDFYIRDNSGSACTFLVDGVMLTEGSVPPAYSDLGIPIDAVSNQPSTAQADTLTSADATVKSPAPVEADTGTLADSPTTQSVTQQFPADTITGTDATVNAPSHVEADTGTLADVDAEQSGKSTTASDSLTGTDANVNAPSTAQADTLTSADAQVKAPSTAQADTGTLADANVNAPNAGPADTITGTDANISAPSHAEADTGTLADATVNAPAPAASDSLTGTDATAKAPSTAQADTGTFAEALVKDVALTKADLPTISDALVDDYRIILTDSATLGDSVTEQIFTFAPPPPIKLPTHPIIDPKRTFSLIVQTTTTATIDAKVTRCAIGAFKTTVGISPYHTTTAITRISSAAAIDRKGTSVTINA